MVFGLLPARSASRGAGARAGPSPATAVCGLVLIGIERTNLGIVASGPVSVSPRAGSTAGQRQQPLRGADASGECFYHYQRRVAMAPMPLAAGVSTIASAAVSSRGAAVIRTAQGRVADTAALAGAVAADRTRLQRPLQDPGELPARRRDNNNLLVARL